MQKAQNRWSVISLSITSSSLQQLSKLLLSSQKPHGGHDRSYPGATSSYRHKPHTCVKKGTGKPMKGLKRPCRVWRAVYSQPFWNWGLQVTSHSSRNRWGSLHVEKEPNRVQGPTATQAEGQGAQSPTEQDGWPSPNGFQGWTDGSNTCHVPEHPPGPAHQQQAALC